MAARRIGAGKGRIAVAGHICLDIIPTMQDLPSGSRASLAAGKLYVVGPAVVSTGGTVANVGIALHRLGLPVRLLGKVGDDLFGRAILDVLSGHGRNLADDMIVSRGATSSYSVVISPPGVDRTFLHCPGANDTFRAADLSDKSLAGCRLLHFGYPPLMKRMYADGGRELQRLLRRVKGLGLTTTLDMAMPDPDSPAGRCDWRAILAGVLPYVDFFLPSLEETVQMLRCKPPGDVLDGDFLAKVADELLGWGVAGVVLKLGAAGLYLKTASDQVRLAACGAIGLDSVVWTGREMLAPCFRVQVAGTTGAGDCTIAGFLAGLAKGLPPPQALTAAVAVGACNVERHDASSGIISWRQVQRRISAGWKRLPTRSSLEDWRQDRREGVWLASGDPGR
jgi:sugar/nucleoside kinase (ribokinase family)